MKAGRAILVFVVVAAIAHVLAVAAAPRLINAFVMHKIASQGGGVNRAIPAPRADAHARTVVRPSPDLLYTACVFDLSERPLHVTAPVQDSYVSVAGFAADTTNFFAINDSTLQPGPDGKKVFDVVLSTKPMQGPPGARVIVAPSAKGLVLFRSLITSDAELPKLKEFQEQQRCDPL